jgi:hypothetical protein
MWTNQVDSCSWVAPLPLIDDTTQYMWISLLTVKSDTTPTIKKIKVAVEVEVGQPLRVLLRTNKLKKDESDMVIKNKMCLMAKGYMQQAGINFEEVFAPVAHMESIHVITALTTDGGWEVHHMDMKTTFLVSELTKKVCVH